MTSERTPDTVIIDVDAGDITLRPSLAGVSTRWRAAWSWGKPTITEHWEGQALRLSAECPPIAFGPGCVVDFTVGLPAGVAVVARSDVGDVTADTLSGDLTLTSSTGAIRVSDSSGVLVLRTEVGDITAVGLTSPAVEAHTADGDVTVRFTARDAYRVLATASLGDASVAVRQDPTSARVVVASADVGDVVIGYD